jgi:2-isopropylmalate synthase
MDAQGREVTASDIWKIFESEYRLAEGSVTLSDLTQADIGAGRVRVAADATVSGRHMAFEGEGNGPVDAFVDGLSRAAGVPVKVLNYHEHSMGGGAQARAAAYVEVRVGDAAPVFGVGIDANIVRATLLAVLSASSRGTSPVSVDAAAAVAQAA